MAEGGNGPERRGKAFPCQLCHVRSVATRALGTHYLRAHQRCLEYGSNRPREMNEGEWELKMAALKRSQRNNYDKRHGRSPYGAAPQSGEEGAVSGSPQRPVPCQAFMNLTQPLYHSLTHQSSIPSLMGLDFTEPPRDPYPGRYRPRSSGAPATVSKAPEELSAVTTNTGAPATESRVELYTFPGRPFMRLTVEPDVEPDALVMNVWGDSDIEVYAASDSRVPEEDLAQLRADDERELMQVSAVRSVSAEELGERLGTGGVIQGGSLGMAHTVPVEEGPRVAAPGSDVISAEEAERRRVASHLQALLMADGVHQPHEALQNVASWVQSILGTPCLPLPPSAPEPSQSEHPQMIVEAVSGTVPMDTLDPFTPSVSLPIQEPPSTPAIPVVTPPHPAAYSDISSEYAADQSRDQSSSIVD